MPKKTKLIMLLNDIHPPFFLSPIDFIQNLRVELFIQGRFLSNDLVTVEDILKIAWPILESYITDKDIDIYEELKNTPEINSLMAKCPKINNAIQGRKMSQMIHNYQRIHIAKEKIS